METQKLSGEGLAIQMKMEQLWNDLQLLDEAIVRYIESRGETKVEIYSYKGYFDKRFPALAEKMRGIDMGITDLLKED